MFFPCPAVALDAPGQHPVDLVSLFLCNNINNKATFSVAVLVYRLQAASAGSRPADDGVQGRDHRI